MVFFEPQEDMDVVGHDDEGVELVAVVVEVMEGAGDDGVVFAEAAGAVRFVEFVFEGEDEAALVFGSGFRVPWFWVGFEVGVAGFGEVGDD